MNNNPSSVPNLLNIGDVLRLALPLQTVVMAQAQQTRRNLFWAVILTDWKHLTEQVQLGDLVIVPPNLQAQVTDADLQKRLQNIARLSVAAVLFFNDVSDDISNSAKTLDLPILIVPSSSSVRDVHKAITALLIDQQTATTERGMQLYRKLSEMSREGQGITAMTEVMSNLTGKIIIVQDKRLEIQAYTVPRDQVDEFEALQQVLTKREELPAVLRNRKAAARARQSYWQQLLPIEGIGRVISPIVSGDRARGYLSVVGPADDLDLLDSLTVEHGAAACALEMAKAKAVSEAKKSLRGDFLEGLLAGTLPRKEFERLADRLDHDTTPPHAILTFTWHGENTPSLRRLETMLNWLLANHSRSALVHIYGEQHICVFQALKSDSDDMDSARQLASRLQEQVKTEYADARLMGGLSGPAPSLSDWPNYYEEAVQAMLLSERLNLNHVVEFNSLGVYRLLAQLEDIPTVRTFTRQVLGPLIDYDAQHRSSLVQTLDAYFNHHGNISQTAESLFIHRNTLLYRLERIQELTKQDMNQANMRLSLQLALKLWQLQPDPA